MNAPELMTAAVAANPFDETAQLALADALTEATGDHEKALARAKRVALEARIAAFVAHADALTRKNWEESKYTFSPPPTHRADYISAKWVRVVTIEHSHERGPRVGSVYAFICLYDGYTKQLGTVKTGDIHKADGFKRAAKHARGSVFTEDFGKCATTYGINYLRSW